MAERKYKVGNKVLNSDELDEHIDNFIAFFDHNKDNPMNAKEIQYVEIGGRQVAAYKVICPNCKILDLDAEFDTSETPWKVRCSEGHEWQVNPEAEA